MLTLARGILPGNLEKKWAGSTSVKIFTASWLALAVVVFVPWWQGRVEASYLPASRKGRFVLAAVGREASNSKQETHEQVNV